MRIRTRPKHLRSTHGHLPDDFGEPVLPDDPDDIRPGYDPCPAAAGGLSCIRPDGHGSLHIGPHRVVEGLHGWIRVPAMDEILVIEDVVITILISSLDETGMLM